MYIVHIWLRVWILQNFIYSPLKKEVHISRYIPIHHEIGLNQSHRPFQNSGQSETGPAQTSIEELFAAAAFEEGSLTDWLMGRRTARLLKCSCCWWRYWWWGWKDPWTDPSAGGLDGRKLELGSMDEDEVAPAAWMEDKAVWKWGEKRERGWVIDHAYIPVLWNTIVG